MSGIDRPILEVWIPRCGGSSLWRAVALTGCKRAWVKDSRSATSLLSGSFRFATYQHLSLPWLIENCDLDVDEFRIVGCVRNPWDRLVSVYHHLTRLGNKRRYDRLKSIVRGGFTQFAEWATSGGAPNVRMNPHGCPYVYASPQVDWLTVNGQIAVDVLGRFEKINEYAADVLRGIGISGKLPHINGVRRKPYLTFYNDTLRRRVGEFYKEDCETFEYTFSND